MLINKAIEINEENIKLLLSLSEGLKKNIENMKEEQDEGVIETSAKNYTEIEIKMRSYYITKEKKIGGK
jgi:exoribonuclease II